MTNASMWECPQCRRSFANRNQTHSCGLFTLEHHFSGKPHEIRAIYDAFVAAIEECGPVTVLPEKTRIAFQVRMSFAQLTPRQRWVDGHLVLARRVEHAWFRSVQSISPRCHVHSFRFTHAHQIDDDVKAWLREAYAVGAQEHLAKRSGHRPS